MKSAEREKICYNCEGRIALDAETCPYCASDQTRSSMQNSFQTPIFQNQSLEDSLTSLFTPPYQGKRPQFSEPTHQEEENQSMPVQEEMPLYREVTEKPQMDPMMGAPKPESQEEPSQNALLPTILLVIGANLFILGMMQLIFSKDGFLRLEWDASNWFFYCLIGAPLLYFGYKKYRALS